MSDSAFLARKQRLFELLPIRASREMVPFSALPAGGIPRGALTEIHGASGSGKSELVIRFLAENRGLRAAWIEDELTVYPCAFPLSGVELERVLFVEAGRESLWAAHQILRSRLFQVVILTVGGALQAPHEPREPRAMDEMDLRRLQLASEKAQASVILLSEKPVPRRSWPIALQLQVSRDARISKVRVLKGRS